MSNEAENSIQSVRTAFTIIELLRELNKAGVTEISEELDIPASTVHSHLTTLKHKGYVSQEQDKYSLGLNFVYLGDHAKHQMDLYRVGKSHLKDLAEQTNEVTNILIEEGGRGVYIKVTRGEGSLNLESYSRDREYLHCTAAGKAILAFESEELVSEMIESHGLPKFTENTITTKKELHEELESVRDAGYAFDDEERLDGLRCVAAPVQNRNGGVYGAISVSGPTIRMNKERFRDALPEAVSNTAKAIEIEINY